MSGIISALKSAVLLGAADIDHIKTMDEWQSLPRSMQTYLGSLSPHDALDAIAKLRYLPQQLVGISARGGYIITDGLLAVMDVNDHPEHVVVVESKCWAESIKPENWAKSIVKSMMNAKVKYPDEVGGAVLSLPSGVSYVNLLKDFTFTGEDRISCNKRTWDMKVAIKPDSNGGYVAIVEYKDTSVTWKTLRDVWEKNGKLEAYDSTGKAASGFMSADTVAGYVEIPLEMMDMGVTSDGAMSDVLTMLAGINQAYGIVGLSPASSPELSSFLEANVISDAAAKTITMVKMASDKFGIAAGADVLDYSDQLSLVPNPADDARIVVTRVMQSFSHVSLQSLGRGEGGKLAYARFVTYDGSTPVRSWTIDSNWGMHGRTAVVDAYVEMEVIAGLDGHYIVFEVKYFPNRGSGGVYEVTLPGESTARTFARPDEFLANMNAFLCALSDSGQSPGTLISIDLDSSGLSRPRISFAFDPVGVTDGSTVPRLSGSFSLFGPFDIKDTVGNAYDTFGAYYQAVTPGIATYQRAAFDFRARRIGGGDDMIGGTRLEALRAGHIRVTPGSVAFTTYIPLFTDYDPYSRQRTVDPVAKLLNDNRRSFQVQIEINPVDGHTSVYPLDSSGNIVYDSSGSRVGAIFSTSQEAADKLASLYQIFGEPGKGMLFSDAGGRNYGFRIDNPNEGSTSGIIGQLVPSAVDGHLHGVLDLAWIGCNVKGSKYVDSHLKVDVEIDLYRLASSSDPWNALEFKPRSAWPADPVEAFGRDQIALILERIQAAAKYRVKFGKGNLQVSSVMLEGSELEVTFGMARMYKDELALECVLSEDIRPSALATPGHGFTIDHLFDINWNPVDPQGIVFHDVGSWLVLQGLAWRQSTNEGIPWIDLSGSDQQKEFAVTSIQGQPQYIQIPVRVPAVKGTNGWPTLEMMTVHFDSTTGGVVVDSLPYLHGVVLSNWFGPGNTPIVAPFTVGSLDAFLECLAHNPHFEPVSHFLARQPVYTTVTFGTVINGLLPITVCYQGVASGSVTVFCDLASHYFLSVTHSTTLHNHMNEAISEAFILS
jgi:hypothetical protein